MGTLRFRFPARLLSAMQNFAQNLAQNLDSAHSQVEQRLQQFRDRYPMGGVVTSVAAIHGESYVVQAVLSVGGLALTSGLAEASTLEGAEAIAQLIALDRFNPAERFGPTGAISREESSSHRLVSPSPNLPSAPPQVQQRQPDVIPSKAESAKETEAIAQLIALDRFNPAERFGPAGAISREENSSHRLVSPSPNLPSAPPQVQQRQPDVIPSKAESAKETEVKTEATSDTEAASIGDSKSIGNSKSLQAPADPVEQSLVEPVVELEAEPEEPPTEAPQPLAETRANPIPEPSAKPRRRPRRKKAAPAPASESVTPPPEALSEAAAAEEEEEEAPQPKFVADWSDDLAQIEVELKRLSWNKQQEADYLQRTYGKPSRDYITDYSELTDFLSYLRSLPSHFVPEPYETSAELTGLPKITGELPPEAPQPLGSTLYPEPETEINIPADYERGVDDPSVTPVPTLSAPELNPPSDPQPEHQPEPEHSPESQSDFGGLSRDDMMQQTAAECKRLKWTNRQGSNFLKSRYEKATRKDLSDGELWDFLQYLSSIAPVETSVTEKLPF